MRNSSKMKFSKGKEKQTVVDSRSPSYLAQRESIHQLLIQDDAEDGNDYLTEREILPGTKKT